MGFDKRSKLLVDLCIFLTLESEQCFLVEITNTDAEIKLWPQGTTRGMP